MLTGVAVGRVPVLTFVADSVTEIRNCAGDISVGNLRRPAAGHRLASLLPSKCPIVVAPHCKLLRVGRNGMIHRIPIAARVLQGLESQQLRFSWRRGIADLGRCATRDLLTVLVRGVLPRVQALNRKITVAIGFPGQGVAVMTVVVNVLREHSLGNVWGSALRRGGGSTVLGPARLEDLPRNHDIHQLVPRRAVAGVRVFPEILADSGSTRLWPAIIHHTAHFLAILNVHLVALLAVAVVVLLPVHARAVRAAAMPNTIIDRQARRNFRKDSFRRAFQRKELRPKVGSTIKTVTIFTFVSQSLRKMYVSCLRNAQCRLENLRRLATDDRLAELVRHVQGHVSLAHGIKLPNTGGLTIHRVTRLADHPARGAKSNIPMLVPRSLDLGQRATIKRSTRRHNLVVPRSVALSPKPLLLRISRVSRIPFAALVLAGLVILDLTVIHQLPDWHVLCDFGKVLPLLFEHNVQLPNVSPRHSGRKSAIHTTTSQVRNRVVSSVAARNTELGRRHRRTIDCRSPRTAVARHLSKMNHLLGVSHMLGARNLGGDAASHRLAVLRSLLELPVLATCYVKSHLVGDLAAESVPTLTAVCSSVWVHDLRSAHDRMLQLRRSSAALGLAHRHAGIKSSGTGRVVRRGALQIIARQGVPLLALHVTLSVLRSISFGADFCSMGHASGWIALHQVAHRSAEPLADVEVTDQRIVHEGITRLAHDGTQPSLGRWTTIRTHVR
mmetsp:Transcript_32652/g.75000  ORF Transcript_32652/g.75000 Transcript_32652/m.75000 type:complete len:726 (+) Transcript_32652:2285-4462(+)